MKNKKILASIALILFFIFISPTIPMVSAQNTSSATSYAYISNAGNNTVSVIDTATNNVTDTVPVGSNPNSYGQFIGYPEQQELSIAQFSTNVASGYSPLAVQFTGLYENTTGWYWDFGDGSYSTEPNPIHTYSTPGNYTVSLRTTNTNGVTIKNATLIVYKKTVLPTADFDTGGVYGGYSPFTMNFTDHSRNATGWYWDFGDGSHSTEQNPTHTFYDNETFSPFSLEYPSTYYSVTLTAINENGTDNKSENVIIYAQRPVCYAVFDSIPEENDPLTLQFTDSSINIPDMVFFWQWDFGDGTTSNEQNPLHTYESPGNYTVTLTASGDWSQGKTSQKISVKELTAPVADFSASTISGVEPLKVKFTDMSTAGPRSWNWNFGDGTASTERNPVHTYYSAGNYTVNLTESNGKGTDSKIAMINVLEQTVLPVANFSSRVTFGYAPLSVQFTDLAENATVWNWSFGDGATSAEQNPTHIYSTAGNYTVNLKVRNARGMDSKTTGITILPNSSNTMQYVYIANYYSGTISVIDIATNKVVDTVPVGINPLGVAVNPTGTKVYVAALQNSLDSENFLIIDAASNTITAKLPIGSVQGCMKIAVNPTGKEVYVAKNDDISIIDTATNNVTDTVPVGENLWGVTSAPDGTKVYVIGDYGISIIDTATYKVTTKVEVGNWPKGIAVSPDGKKVYVANSGDNNVLAIDTATNKVTTKVEVGYWPEGIAVSSDGKKVFVANYYSSNVSVIDTTTNTVTATVDVGDYPEGVAVDPEGTKVYVTNSIENSASVIDIATNNVTDTVPVGDHPQDIAVRQFITLPSALKPVIFVANFSGNITDGNAPFNVKFTDLSENATKWNWDFGDGNTSIEQNPVHSYPLGGNYTVTLTVTGEQTQNTISKVISVQGSNTLVANFSASPACGKAPLKVSFKDKSTGSPATWKWCFGDGTSSKDRNPMHSYCKAGEYNVTLIVNNTEGSNKVTKTEYIRVSKQKEHLKLKKYEKQVDI